MLRRVDVFRPSTRSNDHLLAGHDATSLAAWLERGGGSASQSRATARKVLRFSWNQDALGPAAWDETSLANIGVGSWARGRLLELDPSPSLSIADEVIAEDGTIRLALQARDGGLVEAVLIPGPARTTLCISSQVGCARACSFCETGRLGLLRQMSAAEIVDQVRIARDVRRSRNAAVPRERRLPELSNIVFMGMGEPMDNLDQVLQSLRVIGDPHALGFARSRVTVSTVGVVDKLEPFFAANLAELAVSLNAPDDVRRSAIMPINQRAPLSVLREAIERSLPKGRRVLFEYVLFDRWNDAPEDADLLAEWTRGLRCRVNVIPCNEGPDPALRPPSPGRLETFVQHLSAHGVVTLVRRPRGRDVGGACGQLAGALRSAPA